MFQPKILSALTLFAASAAFALYPQQDARANSRLRCTATSRGFQISLQTQTGNRTLLNIENSASAGLSCSQIATRLERAINAPNLERMLLVGDPDGRVCIVRSTSIGCRTESQILRIPRGIDAEQFFQSVLSIGAEGSYVGDASQHTSRRYYLRFGRALNSIVRR